MHLRIIFAILAAFFFSGLEAYPEGAPLSSCDDMLPEHGAGPDPTPCPFETLTDTLQIDQGGSVGLTLQNITGQTYSFLGYLTMAFDSSKSDEDGPIGTFAVPSNGKTLDCFGLTASAITHSNNDSKKKVTAVWTAPSDFTGTVVFKTTFVRGYRNFWPKQPTAPVTVGVSAVKKGSYRVNQRA